MNPATWQAHLAAAGLMPADEAAAALPDAGAPWYLRLLAGIGGFIGGLMLLLFFGAGLASLKLFESTGGAVFIGLLLCAAAVFVYHMARDSAAGEQAGLAVSIAGQLALAIGVLQLFKASSAPSWWPQVAVQILLLVLIRNGLHRTLTAATALVLGSLSCSGPATLTAWWGTLALAAALGVAFEGRLIARGQGGLMAPVVFGVLAGVILCQVPWVLNLWPRHLSTDGSIAFAQPWLAAAPAVLLAAWLCAASASPITRGATLLLAAVVMTLGLWLPAWNAALLLALLGLASARPGWAVIAALAMIWSVSRYYYVMQVTLIEKAAWMAAAGLMCLVLAALVRTVAPRLMNLDDSREAE